MLHTVLIIGRGGGEQAHGDRRSDRQPGKLGSARRPVERRQRHISTTRQARATDSTRTLPTLSALWARLPQAPETTTVRYVTNGIPLTASGSKDRPGATPAIGEGHAGEPPPAAAGKMTVREQQHDEREEHRYRRGPDETPSHPSVELQWVGPPAVACHMASERKAAERP